MASVELGWVFIGFHFNVDGRMKNHQTYSIKLIFRFAKDYKFLPLCKFIDVEISIQLSGRFRSILTQWLHNLRWLLLAPFLFLWKLNTSMWCNTFRILVKRNSQSTAGELGFEPSSIVIMRNGTYWVWNISALIIKLNRRLKEKLVEVVFQRVLEEVVQ